MSITGGDWKVAGTTQSRYIDARQPDGMVQEVAWCGQCEYGDNIDNARLLCAAPDLLAALDAMCEEFRGHDLPYGSSAYQKAISAINKARNAS
jgi:hypothetical protein